MKLRSSRKRTPAAESLPERPSTQSSHDDLAGYRGGSLAIRRPSLMRDDAALRRDLYHHGLWGE
jgi:hypothetical protein